MRHNVQVVETSDVLVTSEELQQLQLTERPFAENGFGKDIGDLLDGYRRCAVASIVFGQTDDSISTMAQFFHHCEAVVDNELLVVDGVDGLAGILVGRHEEDKTGW